MKYGFFAVHLFHTNKVAHFKAHNMNSYTVELTSGIEIIAKGNNEAEALQDAKTQAAEINQSVLGDGNIQKLDCSISF